MIERSLMTEGYGDCSTVSKDAWIAASR